MGKQLVELVERRGAIAFHAPALSEVPDLDPAQIAELLRALEKSPPAAIIFQTGVGTQALFAATDRFSLTGKIQDLLKKSIVVARGPKPSAALRSRGVRIDR